MRAATWRGAAGALILLSASADPALAAEKLMLATGKSGAPSYAAGVGLSSLIKFELLPKENIDLQPLDSTGAIDNVRLLQSGEADLAILPSAIGHAARLGIGSFAGAPPTTGFRAIATLWRDALHMILRADDVDTGTIDDLAGLKGKKLFLGEASTGMVDVNRLLLADLGLDAGHRFELTAVADGDGIAAIKRGEVDAFSVTARPPEPRFDTVFGGAKADLRLLDVTEDQMTRANGNHWLWTPYVIPARTYPGQDGDIDTIALSNLLVVRADVDPDVVYAITRSVFENLPYLERVDPLLADLSLDNALAGMALPLHPGALRYYREAGLIPTVESVGSPSPSPMTPVGQEDNEPSVAPTERYPGGDVAGDLPVGAGGPLLKTTPADGNPEGEATTRQAPASTPGGLRPSEATWRKRATL